MMLGTMPIPIYYATVLSDHALFGINDIRYLGIQQLSRVYLLGK